MVIADSVHRHSSDNVRLRGPVTMGYVAIADTARWSVALADVRRWAVSSTDMSDPNG
jgi:hypothetical protein